MKSLRTTNTMGAPFMRSLIAHGWGEIPSTGRRSPVHIPTNGRGIHLTPDRIVKVVPSRLRRYQQQGHDHFITFSCYRRLPFLDNDQARTTFETTLEQLRVRHAFRIFGYVLMPEHVHLLLSEPTRLSLQTTLSVLKGETSKVLKGERKQFWQTRYYDFNVLTHPKLVEKLCYLHRNPVKRGLVTKPEDWRWSSYRHWLTGEIGPVEIESHWTWKLREQAGLPHSFTPPIAIPPR